MTRTERSGELYIRTDRCEFCSRKLWKGYFVMVPDKVQSLIIKVVCWRCKLSRVLGGKNPRR